MARDLLWRLRAAHGESGARAGQHWQRCPRLHRLCQGSRTGGLSLLVQGRKGHTTGRHNRPGHRIAARRARGSRGCRRDRADSQLAQGHGCRGDGACLRCRSSSNSRTTGPGAAPTALATCERGPRARATGERCSGSSARSAAGRRAGHPARFTGFAQDSGPAGAHGHGSPAEYNPFSRTRQDSTRRADDGDQGPRQVPLMRATCPRDTRTPLLHPM